MCSAHRLIIVSIMWLAASRSSRSVEMPNGTYAGQNPVRLVTSGSRHASAPEPTACTNSSYAELAAAHPDSLSMHERQRLQTVEYECEAAHDGDHSSGHHGSAWTDGNHGMLWMGAGLLMVLMMAAMMI